MCDIKNVIALLCKHIELSTGLEVKPEYFKFAKINNKSTEAAKCFWSILNRLSHFAVKNLQPAIDFLHYDIVKSTKLYLGYLQYPGIGFYGLLEDTENLRELLLALAWLVGKQSVLETTVKFNLVDSILSGKSTHIEDLERGELQSHQLPSDILSQTDAIIHKSCRISSNLKEITGLVGDKVKTTVKVHVASLNSCGLAHLHVPEAAIIKRYACNNEEFSKIDQKSLEELKRLGMLLDVHAKFSKKEHIFFEWMTTVLEEHKDQGDQLPQETIDELSTFVCVIRHLSKKKIHVIKHGDDNSDSGISKTPVASRFLRSQEKETEVETWNAEIVQKLSLEESQVSVRMDKLTKELRLILKSIPNCIQI